MSKIDIVYSKINIIKNCVAAIGKATREVSDPDFQLGLYELNLQRAIQACIDLAHVTIAAEGLALPSTYRQAFDVLCQAGLIPAELRDALQGMVGFRNISVHDYQEILPEIVRAIVARHLGDFEKFYTVIYDRARSAWDPPVGG
jgi:uncharacterized protein YutE (UPF0331/DUF86 family)